MCLSAYVASRPACSFMSSDLTAVHICIHAHKCYSFVCFQSYEKRKALLSEFFIIKKGADRARASETKAGGALHAQHEEARERSVKNNRTESYRCTC